MNLNRGYLFRGKCFRSLIVFNCLFDHTYYISSTVQPNLAWISLSCTQTAIDEAARTVARDTLQRRAQLHNLRIVEKGGDGHCLEYSVQDQLRQQGIDCQTMQVLRPALASFIEDKAEYFQGFLTDEESEPDAWRGLLDDIQHSEGAPSRTFCWLQGATIDPVALLHALVTWSRLLCCLKILLLQIFFVFPIQVIVPTALGSSNTPYPPISASRALLCSLLAMLT